VVFIGPPKTASTTLKRFFVKCARNKAAVFFIVVWVLLSKDMRYLSGFQTDVSFQILKPESRIKCEEYYDSCEDPVGVVGEWVYTANKTFTTNVCCGWGKVINVITFATRRSMNFLEGMLACATNLEIGTLGWNQVCRALILLKRVGYCGTGQFLLLGTAQCSRWQPH
jgi:hypothetical protein